MTALVSADRHRSLPLSIGTVTHFLRFDCLDATSWGWIAQQEHILAQVWYTKQRGLRAQSFGWHTWWPYARPVNRMLWAWHGIPELVGMLGMWHRTNAVVGGPGGHCIWLSCLPYGVETTQRLSGKASYVAQCSSWSPYIALLVEGFHSDYGSYLTLLEAERTAWWAPAFALQLHLTMKVSPPQFWVEHACLA